MFLWIPLTANNDLLAATQLSIQNCSPPVLLQYCAVEEHMTKVAILEQRLVSARFLLSILRIASPIDVVLLPVPDWYNVRYHSSQTRDPLQSEGSGSGALPGRDVTVASPSPYHTLPMGNVYTPAQQNIGLGSETFQACQLVTHCGGTVTARGPSDVCSTHVTPLSAKRCHSQPAHFRPVPRVESPPT